MQYKGGFCVLDWHAAALLICPSTLFHIVVDFCHLRLSKVEEIEESAFQKASVNHSDQTTLAVTPFSQNCPENMPLPHLPQPITNHNSILPVSQTHYDRNMINLYKEISQDQNPSSYWFCLAN